MSAVVTDYQLSGGKNVGAITASIPANNAAQLLIAWVAGVSNITSPVFSIATPSGWTLINARNSTNDGGCALFWKVGDGSAVETFGFNKTVQDGAVFIGVVDGAALSLPIDVSITGGETSTVHTVASGSTSVANDLVLLFMSLEFFNLNDSWITGPAGMSSLVTNGSGSGPLPIEGYFIASAVQTAAGATGVKSASTIFPESGAHVLVAIKPYPGPSKSTVLYPNGGESLTAGATVTLNCAPATSPSVAQSALQYEYSYSTNYGGTWTTIGLSATGVTSKAWTVPNVIGAGNLIRVRAFDGSLYSAEYDQSDAPFSIVSETSPGAPVITSPAAGTVQVKSAALPIAWMHQGGAGNPETKYTLKWSHDNFASHTVTIGPVTSGAQTANIDVSGEADGATISVKVLTTGVTLDSPYSSVVSFTIASAPATPTITAPVSAPANPFPTVSFTEASAFVARRMRTDTGYDSGEVAGNATSFTSGYAFLNGVPVTFYLSVKNQYGLWSAEASQTVTPAYTGPAKPSASYTVVTSGGYILITISNSDTPAYDEIWRRPSGAAKSAAMRLTPSLPINANFADYSGQSAQGYIYFIRAYASNGLFTDSDDSAVQTIVLPNLFLHAVSRTNTSSNVLGIVASLLNLSGAHGYKDTTTSVALLGRKAAGSVSGQAVWETISVSTIITLADEAVLNNVFVRWRAQKPPTSAVLCVRDNFGNRFFCKMSKPHVVADVNMYMVAFSLEQTSYSEAI